MLLGGLAGDWFSDSLAVAGRVTIVFATFQHLFGM